ncbi:hypothetical protein WMF20_47130 [Sorangium sp. So ce834]|uniref:hypothetical protein n=1 Tax=Sorangium sp. So ce834 TaxID=3133321 RepID=UPI003F6144B4
MRTKFFGFLATLSVAISCGGDSATTSSTTSTGTHDDTNSASSGGPMACVPGQQVECACIGGATGVQKCLPDGSGFEDCQGCPSGTGGAGGTDCSASSTGAAGAGTGGAGGAFCPCTPGTELACNTACGTVGKVICTADCQIPNNCVPPTETCNGQDDDCRNGADDIFECIQGAIIPCSTACGTIGTHTCSAACTLPIACNPPAETCNAIDDDCSGVADDGLPLFGEPFSIGGADARRPKAAYSGSAYGVSYLDITPDSWKVKLQRFDSAGMLLGSAIEVDGVTAGIPDISWNGSAFGIAWAETYTGSGVYFRTYSESGVALSPIFKIASSNSQSGVTMAASGTDFLVAFDDYTGLVSSSFKVVKVNTSGQTIASHDLTPPSARVMLTRLVPSGAAFKLFWSDNRSGKYAVFARDLDVNGMPTGPEVPVTDGTGDAEAWSATKVPLGYVIGYSSFEASGESFLLTTDATGIPTGEPVNIGSSGQFPEVNWNGTFLAVLNGDMFRLFDAQLRLVAGPFTFHSPATNNIRYSNLLWANGRYFAMAGTDGGPSDPPVARLFGPLGCNAP